MNFLKKYIVNWEFNKNEKETSVKVRFESMFLVAVGIILFFNAMSFVQESMITAVFLMVVAIGVVGTSVFRKKDENDFEFKKKNS